MDWHVNLKISASKEKIRKQVATQVQGSGFTVHGSRLNPILSEFSLCFQTDIACSLDFVCKTI